MIRYSAPSPLYPLSVVAKILNKSERTVRSMAKNDSSFPVGIRVNNKLIGFIPEEINAWNK